MVMIMRELLLIGVSLFSNLFVIRVRVDYDEDIVRLLLLLMVLHAFVCDGKS